MIGKYEELLELIKGTRGLGPGIRTHPKAEENDQKLLHEACLELEKEGKIYRAIEEEGWILWKAMNAS